MTYSLIKKGINYVIIQHGTNFEEDKIVRLKDEIKEEFEQRAIKIFDTFIDDTKQFKESLFDRVVKTAHV